jgi:hypothetical protein
MPEVAEGVTLTVTVSRSHAPGERSCGDATSHEDITRSADVGHGPFFYQYLIDHVEEKPARTARLYVSEAGDMLLQDCPS